MVNLIKKIKLSKKNPTVGESIRLQELSDPAADVSINGVYGATLLPATIAENEDPLQVRIVKCLYAHG